MSYAGEDYDDRHYRLQAESELAKTRAEIERLRAECASLREYLDPVARDAARDLFLLGFSIVWHTFDGRTLHIPSSDVEIRLRSAPASAAEIRS